MRNPWPRGPRGLAAPGLMPRGPVPGRPLGMRFAIGLVCGLAVLGAYVIYQQIELREKPCLESLRRGDPVRRGGLPRPANRRPERPHEAQAALARPWPRAPPARGRGRRGERRRLRERHDRRHVDEDAPIAPAHRGGPEGHHPGADAAPDRLPGFWPGGATGAAGS